MKKVERRSIRFAHLNEAVADARRLASGPYEWAGNWSLEQNLSHLNKGLQMAFEPTEFGIPFIVRPALRWMFLNRMERLGSEAIRFRGTAPPALQPQENLVLDSLLADFERLCGQVEAINAVFVPRHPVFGRFNTEQWRVMQRWHCAHHLSHLIPAANGTS